MTAYMLVIVCLSLSFILHAFLYRVRKKYSVMAYLFGLVMLLYFIRIGYVLLPWASVALYILYSCLTILLFIAVSLGTELPSSIILASFKKKPVQSETMLTALFSDRGLIHTRLDDLLTSRMVQESGNTLKLTKGGHFVWKIMRIYRVIFNRNQTE